MEDDERLLARLDRIETLERAGVSRRELLPELRSLLREAEAGYAKASPNGESEGRWSGAVAGRVRGT